MYVNGNHNIYYNQCSIYLPFVSRPGTVQRTRGVGPYPSPIASGRCDTVAGELIKNKTYAYMDVFMLSLHIQNHIRQAMCVYLKKKKIDKK